MVDLENERVNQMRRLGDGEEIESGGRYNLPNSAPLGINHSHVMYDEKDNEIYDDNQEFIGKNGLRKRLVNMIDEAGEYEETDHGGDPKKGDNSSGEENQSLLKGKKKVIDTMPKCYSLRRCFGCIISRERRVIDLDGTCRPRRYPTNR